MVTTYQALAVAVIAILPGASYTFGYERVIGSFAARSPDRLIRFLAVSAAFQALLSGVAYTAYRDQIRTGRLGSGTIDPWCIEGVSLAYVIAPALVGLLVGHGRKNKRRWVSWIVNPAPEPRAWDHLWNDPDRRGVLRLRLKSGTWLAGLYGATEDGRLSYAAGYPEEGDLYLALQLRVDPETGEFDRDLDGAPKPVEAGSGLLIRWAEVEYLDFQAITEDTADETG